MSAMKRPLGRGPTSRSLGEENDHHGYSPLYPSVLGAHPPRIGDKVEGHDLIESS